MDDVVFKAVVFVESGDDLHGYYFYNAPHNADYGHINAVHQLTLPKAIAKMNEKGLDPIKNTKVNIKAYYDN